MAAQLLEEAKLAEVTRVLGDIGHDIKNMLMPVLSGADLLKDEIDEQFPRLLEIQAKGADMSYANSQDLLKMIVTNAKRIQDRVREIADAVKGVTSPPHFMPCQIHSIVESVYETLRTYAKEKDITLNSEQLETLPLLEGDERRLFNALYNLVNNAIPEIPRGGSVAIRGRVEEDSRMPFVWPSPTRGAACHRTFVIGSLRLRRSVRRQPVPGSERKSSRM